jgi:hypothetical protein
LVVMLVVVLLVTMVMEMMMVGNDDSEVIIHTHTQNTLDQYGSTIRFTYFWYKVYG